MFLKVIFNAMMRNKHVHARCGLPSQEETGCQQLDKIQTFERMDNWTGIHRLQVIVILSHVVNQQFLPNDGLTINNKLVVTKIVVTLMNPTKECITKIHLMYLCLLCRTCVLHRNQKRDCKK